MRRGFLAAGLILTVLASPAQAADASAQAAPPSSATSMHSGRSTTRTGLTSDSTSRRRRRGIGRADLERDLSIQSLAEVVGLSPQHFAVLFRESIGFTPHQYVNHRRIAYAQELLKKDDVPLVEISMQCGFSSQSQFITTFRKLVGMTPGRFRSSLTSSQS